MSGAAPQFAVYPGGQPGHGPRPGRQYQELWFRLARIPWASIVLVPADAGTSVAALATALAEVGSSLQESPVTAIVADAISYASARAVVDLQPRLTPAAARNTVEVPASEVHQNPQRGSPHDATLLPPSGRAIIAIQPVVDEPLGVAIAHAADVVVVCVELGRSRLDAARRTIDLVGPERIAGVVVVR